MSAHHLVQFTPAELAGLEAELAALDPPWVVHADDPHGLLTAERKSAPIVREVAMTPATLVELIHQAESRIETNRARLEREGSPVQRGLSNTHSHKPLQG